MTYSVNQWKEADDTLWLVHGRAVKSNELEFVVYFDKVHALAIELRKESHGKKVDRATVQVSGSAVGRVRPDNRKDMGGNPVRSYGAGAPKRRGKES